MENSESNLMRNRNYYSINFNVNSWRVIKREFLKLINFPLQSVTDLERLIHQSSEGVSILFEYRNILFIKMKRNSYFINYLRYVLFQVKIIRKGLYLNRQWENKIEASPFKIALDQNRYAHFLKIVDHQKKFFSSKNIKLQAREEKLSNRYSLIISKLECKFEGKKCSLPALDRKLVFENRGVRERAFLETGRVYSENRFKLRQLFSELIKIRDAIATNLGYQNYRDYAHEAKGRFSYTVEDVLKFHRVVETEVVPVMQQINGDTREALALDVLRPWDIKIGDTNLPSPYRNREELFEKSTSLLSEINGEYGRHFKELWDHGYLDLFSRKNKSLGSYNIPLFERKASFILTNFIEENGDYSDIALLHHEFGHALHHYFTADESLMAYRNFPSEVSELAAMSMELFALEHLDAYYPNSELKQEAKRQQFKRFLQVIISRCLGDAFQHWIYTYPNADPQERENAYVGMMGRFEEGIVWEGLGKYQTLESLKSLHFFQTPFYYVEYSFAALGAIDLYRSYKMNRKSTLDLYEKFLRLGYSKDIHILYREAGTLFEFSRDRVRGLMAFVREELGLPTCT